MQCNDKIALCIGGRVVSLTVKDAYCLDSIFRMPVHFQIFVSQAFTHRSWFIDAECGFVPMTDSIPTQAFGFDHLTPLGKLCMNVYNCSLANQAIHPIVSVNWYRQFVEGNACFDENVG